MERIASQWTYKNKKDGRLAFLDTSHGFYNIHEGERWMEWTKTIENSTEWERMSKFDQWIEGQQERYPFLFKKIDANPDLFDHQVNLKLTQLTVAMFDFINIMAA